jgi:hypothetical protein
VEEELTLGLLFPAAAAGAAAFLLSLLLDPLF